MEGNEGALHLCDCNDASSHIDPSYHWFTCQYRKWCEKRKKPEPPQERIANLTGKCDINCMINTRVNGDHAYCKCQCHKGTLPAVPPSRVRRKVK